MSIPTLDLDVRLRYVAEGAANIVYAFEDASPSPETSSDAYSEVGRYGPDTPPPSEISFPELAPWLEGRLLRLRKDLSTTPSTFDSYQNFRNIILGLFKKEDLVEQALVRLPRALIKSCNLELRNMETVGIRPRTRHGVFIATQEDLGLLVTDMTSKEHLDLTCIEFKPKWLAQSPTAPTGARRCRTCALGALRMSREHGQNSVPKFCPLTLVTGNKDRVVAAVKTLLVNPQDEKLVSLVANFLYDCPILGKLRDLQASLDSKGVLNSSRDDQGILTAMTIRDCTMYIRESLQLLEVNISINIAADF